MPPALATDTSTASPNAPPICWLVDAAMLAGFTDQSHMTRQFRSTYGMPPARWVKMLGR